MDKIDELTPEQERQLVEYRQQCLEIGLATGPADVEAIRPIINMFYTRIGEHKPYIWRVSSPMMAQFIANLGVNLRDNLWDNLRNNLRNNLWVNLGVNLGANLGANLRDNLRDNLLKHVPTNLWGSLEIHWIGHYIFPHRYLRKMHTDEQMRLLDGWETLAKNAFWWYPFKNICLVCDRPTEIHKDENGRLHNAFGPAASFSDGWNTYCWHGVNIPGEFIESPMSIEIINRQDNMEMQRIAIEIMGYDLYLAQSGAALIQHDQFGRLFTFPMEPDRLMVEVINGTPNQDGTDKIYVIPVPKINELTGKTIQTAHEAVAWSYGLLPEQYQPIIRT